jgi:hypothetical protein
MELWFRQDVRVGLFVMFMAILTWIAAITVLSSVMARSVGTIVAYLLN